MSHSKKETVALKESVTFSRWQIALLLAMALGWGLNWPVMKVVIREVPPLTFRGSCLVVGGLGMLLLAYLGGQKLRPPQGSWRVLFWLSLTNIIGWNVMAIYGVAMMSSGRAALLGYTMPVWSMLLSVLWLGNALTLRRVIGLGLGILGVFAMMGTELLALTGAPLGPLLMVGAAWSWAIGIVSLKRFPLEISPMSLTGWLMLLGGIPIMLAALAVDIPRWHMPSLWPAVGLVYNVFIAFMFCYWAWNRIVLSLPVAVSSLSSLITPLIGVFGGMFFLGEKPGLGELLGAICILGAVATVVIPGRNRLA